MHSNNVPRELRSLKQWVCFDVSKGRKLPFTPGTDDVASSNDASTWRSFADAQDDVASGRRQHLGFCFSKSDPYVFIDIDNLNDPLALEVRDRFKTYMQYSVSGEGVHLIGRGKFNGPGKHPKKPEIGLFQDARFCLFTGDVVGESNTILQLSNDDLQVLHTKLGGGGINDDVVESGDYDSSSSSYEDTDDGLPLIPDMTIVEILLDRSKHYDALFRGRWESSYPSQSEADAHLLLGLCETTQSDAQVVRLFTSSRLWNEAREAKKGFRYIDQCMRKFRSKVNREQKLLDGVRKNFASVEDVKEEDVEEEVESPVEADEPTLDVGEFHIDQPQFGKSDLLDTLPAGLVRDIAHYSFQSSYYPLQEASLLVSLMLLSGICGRGYVTPSGLGLNLNLILVGGTSCGKDEFPKGLKRLLKALDKRRPGISSLFGGELASGQSVEEVFASTKRYISYFHEFAESFRGMVNPFAPDFLRSLKRRVMASFNSADLNGTMERRRRASDEGAQESIERPCLCLMGDATPEALYDVLNIRELNTGLLQRFIILNSPASSWSLDKNMNHGQEPSKGLVDRIFKIVEKMDVLDVENKYQRVGQTTGAERMLNKYERVRRSTVLFDVTGDGKKEIINRAAAKVPRVAALLAVSANPVNPVITEEHARWAMNFVEGVDADLIKRFDSGSIGTGQSKQESVVLEKLKQLGELPRGKRAALGMSKAMAKRPYTVSLQVLKKQLAAHPAFVDDRFGAITALERTIDGMARAGVLTKLSEGLHEEECGDQRGTCYTFNELVG